MPRDVPRGEIPDAAAPPLGCAFHPRCPEAVAECGWEARDLRALLEAHWTRRDPVAYEVERALVGRLDALDEPAKVARVGGAGNATEVRGLLESIRRERPEEPLWQGVSEVTEDADGLTVRFHDGVDPALRASGGVQVACVLHPTPVTLGPHHP